MSTLKWQFFTVVLFANFIAHGQMLTISATNDPSLATLQFSGEPGKRYMLFDSVELPELFVKMGEPFTLLSGVTNLQIPVRDPSHFYAAASVEPLLEKISLPVGGLRSSDGRFFKLKVTASSCSGVTLAGIGIKVGVVNPSHADAMIAVIAAFGYIDEACKIGTLPYQISAYQYDITNGGLRSILFVSSKGMATPLLIPAGQSRYIQLLGTANWSSGTYTITILPDMEIQPLVPQSQVHGMIVWSPSTNAVITDPVWANGYGINTNLINVRSY